MNINFHNNTHEDNDRTRDSTNNLLFPERNAVTGFSMKGMLMLLGLVGVVVSIKYFFF